MGIRWPKIIMGIRWPKIIMGIRWPKIIMGIRWPKIITGIRWPKIIMGIRWPKIIMGIRWPKIIMGIRWLKIISYTELWEAIGEKPVILQIRMRKWRLICHTSRKGDESIEKQAFRLESAGSQKERKTEVTWKRTVLEEAGK
jgi:hypothetical protein